MSYCHGFDLRVGSRKAYFISTVIGNQLVQTVTCHNESLVSETALCMCYGFALMLPLPMLRPLFACIQA